MESKPLDTFLEKELARKIDREPSQLAPLVAHLLREGHVPNIQNNSSLRHQLQARSISPREFEAFFVNLAKGIQYTYEKCGFCPSNIAFAPSIRINGRENKGFQLSYWGEPNIPDGKNDILVNWKFVKLWAKSFRKNINLIDSAREDIAFSPAETLIRLGVEEAFHAVQAFVYRMKQTQSPPDGKDPEADRKFYSNNPLEIQAQQFVDAAIAELGLGKQRQR